MKTNQIWIEGKIRSADGLHWKMPNGEIVANVATRWVGEEENFDIVIRDGQGREIFSRQVVIDHDMYGTGFVGAMEADSDSGPEIVVWGTLTTGALDDPRYDVPVQTEQPAIGKKQQFSETNQKSFFLHMDSGGVRMTSFADASPEAKNLVERWLKYIGHQPYSLFATFILMFLGYLLAGLVWLIRAVFQRAPLI